MACMTKVSIAFGSQNRDRVQARINMCTFNVQNEGKNIQISLQMDGNMIECVVVYVSHPQWILETPTSVENGKRYDACLNLAVVLAGIGNADHTFFHRRAINFVRDGAAGGLLAAGALSDCALAVANEDVGMVTYTPNNLPPSVAAWVLHHFYQEYLDPVSILLENKSLVSSIHAHLLRKGNQVALEIAHQKAGIVGNKRSFDGKYKEVQIMCYLCRTLDTYKIDSKPGFDSSNGKYLASRRPCPTCSPPINHKSHSTREDYRGNIFQLIRVYNGSETILNQGSFCAETH
jgi:hypothetical protein